MNIIVLGTRGFPNVQGGVETHCEHLYPRIVSLGYNVTVITRRPYVDPNLLQYKDVKLVAVDCPRNKFLEAILHTLKGVVLAKKLGCDVLHIHAIGPSLFVPLARLLGLRVVITTHGPDYERKKWNWMAKAVLKSGECMGCLFANEIICISKTIADNVRKYYGRNANIIPNGVDVPQRLASEEALRRFNLQKGKYILTVGRFVPEKGFHDLIKAFEKAGTSEMKLVIVGDADHEDEYSKALKEQAADLKNVVLTGRLIGLPLKEIYTHAGLFILPSYYEGLPIVLLEALSYGLSCVASDIPANREVKLEDNRYFRPGDIESLVEKIGIFLAQPLTAEQQKAQIKNITEKYNWDAIAEETVKVYQKAGSDRPQ